MTTAEVAEVLKLRDSELPADVTGRLAFLLPSYCLRRLS